MAGVGIFVRAFVVSWELEETPSEVVPGRILGIGVSAGGLGPLAVFCVYFISNSFSKTKPIPQNITLLEKLTIAMDAIPLKSLIGGDWNMEPRALMDTSFLDCKSLNVCESSDTSGSCISPAGEGTLDYFVIDDDYGEAVSSTLYNNLMPPQPHKPVVMVFKTTPKNNPMIFL